MGSTFNYLNIILLIGLLLSCGSPDLVSCISDIEKVKNTSSLINYPDGRQIKFAINNDKIYAQCFIDSLKIPQDASIEEKAQIILNFTSNNIKYSADPEVSYKSDINRPGTRLPSKTVVDGKGDCEDKATLAALMLKELNIAIFVIQRPPIGNGLGHIFLGIKANYDTGLKCGDDYFVAFDPTIKNAKLNDVEDGVRLVGSFKCGLI